MWLIPLNQLLLQRKNKDFRFSLLQRTNRGFHTNAEVFFFLPGGGGGGWENTSPIFVYMEVERRIASLSLNFD